MPLISINITNAQAQRLVAGLSGKFEGTEPFPIIPVIDTSLQKSGFIVDATKQLWKDVVISYEHSAGLNSYSNSLSQTLKTGVSF